MAYATQQQIQIAAGGSQKLIELTDQEGTGALNATVLAEAQAKAEGLMDGYLRLRYAVPVIPETPEGVATLARLASDETVYQLRRMRQLVDEGDTDARKDREAELAEYRSGERRIDEPMLPKSDAVAAAFVDNCGDVSRETLKGLF